MTYHRTPFLTIRAEGALLPVDLLQRVVENDHDLGGLTPESYHLSGEKLNEAINRSWNRLLGAWAAFSAGRERLVEGDAGTSLTREKWLLPLFDELDYGRLQITKAIDIEGKSYAISHGWDNVPIHLVGFGAELDKRMAGVTGAAKASPHSLVQELLNRSPERTWGFVSNGLRMRVLRDNASLTRQAYLEFDLEAMMNGEVYADFVVLWLVCHQSRVESREQRAENCWLEVWSKAAQERGTRALEGLRGGVEKAIEALGKGFIGHPANGSLRSALSSGAVSTLELYRQLLRLVYRLIFLFVAEDRQLLYDPASDAECRERYVRFYSTARLRRMAERVRGSRHVDLYAALKLVMDKLGNGGAPELGLPALGGFLFSRKAMSALADCELSNEHLLEAVRSLAFTREGRTRRAVDYKNLGSEELGSIYESLLELHPIVNTAATTFELRSVSGSERKTTGSYYTPSSLIQVLLDSTLEPVIEQAIKGVGNRESGVGKPTAHSPFPIPSEAEQALLNLKVIDPACGSGHFLVAASHRLARRLASIRTGEGEPAPEAMRSALRAVISNCIYGVDINPMSVELCKVSLWMEALEPGKPLSFLDAHIKCGNSLIGIALQEPSGNVSLSHITSIPDEALKEVSKDDAIANKNSQNRVKKNKEEKKRILTQRFGQLALPGNEWGVLDSEIIQRVFAGLLEQRKFLEESDEKLSTKDSIALNKKKEELLNSIENSPTSNFWRLRQSLNLWCAIWFWAKPGKTITVHKNNKERQLEVPDVPTTQKYLELVSSLDSPEESEKYRDYFDVLDHIVEKHRFFHWELEFPEIWQKITGDPAASNYGFDVIIGNPPWEVPEAEPKEFSASQYPEVNDLSRDKFKKWFENQLKTDVDFKAKWLEVVRERNLLVRGYKNLLPEGERIVREANLYKGFILRSVWAKPRRLGFIVPSSFHTDASTLPLREVTLLDCNSSLVAITNDALIFPSLPAIFRFDIFACDLEDKNTKLSIAYLPAAITSHLQPEYIKQKMYQLNLNDINQLAPGLLSVPEFQDKDSYNITTKAYRNGVALGMLEPDGKVLFKKEAYNTNEHDGGALVYSGWDVPFCEGATVKPYLWRLSSAEKGYKEDIFSSRFIDHETVWNWRLAFKLIVSQSNVRRMQVCLVPPKTVFGQNVPTLSMHGASLEETVSLLGVLNSFVFEYLVRMKTGAALSKPVLMSLPIPKNTFTDTNFPHYVKTALMGIEGQPRNIIEHLNLHNSNKLLIYYQARAIIDSIVAQSYGLNEKEYASVLRVFNLLDKDQPALPNEEKSYVTRDYAFLEFFNLHKKDAPKDITPFFQVENPRGIILGLEDRVNKAFDLGARPYSQSNLDAENEDGDVYDFDTE